MSKTGSYVVSKQWRPATGDDILTAAATAPPLTDEQLREIAERVSKTICSTFMAFDSREPVSKLGVRAYESIEGRITQQDFDALIADARLHRAELAKARAEIERLRPSLTATLEWITKECRPDARWVNEGHNWNMSNDDRIRGCKILDEARAALVPEKEGG